MFNLFNSKSIITNGHGIIGINLNPKLHGNIDLHNGKEHSFKIDLEIEISNNYYTVSLNDKSNNDIKNFISKIENIIPANPKEQDILIDIHNQLCQRLKWEPIILSHKKKN